MNTQTKIIFNLLKYTYGFVPIVAGLDKFLNILTDWSQYLGPGIAGLMPFEADTLMMIIGLIEMLAGMLVLVQTRLGSLVVSGWLLIIAFVLIFSGHYFDVAVRDIVMAVGAFSLFKLSEIFINREVRSEKREVAGS